MAYAVKLQSLEVSPRVPKLSLAAAPNICQNFQILLLNLHRAVLQAPVKMAGHSNPIGKVNGARREYNTTLRTETMWRLASNNTMKPRNEIVLLSRLIFDLAVGGNQAEEQLEIELHLHLPTYLRSVYKLCICICKCTITNMNIKMYMRVYAYTCMYVYVFMYARMWVGRRVARR